MEGAQRIRVLVVDDSAFIRHTLANRVLDAEDIEVLGTARDGQEALELVEQLRPDVVTLDVEMPRMNGLEALRLIMQRQPTPVVMLSSLTQAGAETTIRALELGAVDFVGKPSGSVSFDIHRVRDELLEKVRFAALVGRRKHALDRLASLARRAVAPVMLSTAPKADARPSSTPVTPSPTSALPPRPPRGLVIIGASTGGPRALREVLSQLQPDGSTAYLVIQHMPAGFTRPLANRINEVSALTVREASHGDRLAPDLVLVAPGDYHLWLDRNGRVEVGQGARLHGVRPSIDIALESAARVRPRRLAAVILTGMGADGTLGAGAVRAAGGYVIAEDESTCVVYGMPRSVIAAGHASEVVPLDGVAAAITRVTTSWNTQPTISTGTSFDKAHGTSPASI